MGLALLSSVRTTRILSREKSFWWRLLARDDLSRRSVGMDAMIIVMLGSIDDQRSTLMFACWKFVSVSLEIWTAATADVALALYL
jgi:hypothetical protein